MIDGSASGQMYWVVSLVELLVLISYMETIKLQQEILVSLSIKFWSSLSISLGLSGKCLSIRLLPWLIHSLSRVYNMFEVQANRFDHYMRQLSRADNALCSIERIRDFLLIEKEPPPNKQGVPPAYWPSSGNIKADHLCAQYSKGMVIQLFNILISISRHLFRWSYGAPRHLIRHQVR